MNVNEVYNTISTVIQEMSYCKSYDCSFIKAEKDEPYWSVLFCYLDIQHPKIRLIGSHSNTRSVTACTILALLLVIGEE